MTPTAHLDDRRRPRRVLHGAVATTLAVGLLGGAATTASAQTAAGTQYANPAGSTAGSVADRLKEIRYASFGTDDVQVRRLVRRALQDAGIAHRNYETTDARLKRFVESELAKGLTSGGANAVGKTVGVELTRVTTRTFEITRALFGPREEVLPLSATVVSRGDRIPKGTADFIEGFAEGVGSTGVPTVYVERSDAPRSFVSTYRRLPGVSVVRNIDEESGRQRLVALLAGGTGSSSAPASTTTDGTLKARTSAAVTSGSDAGGVGAGPIALLVALAGAVLFAVSGLFRRRRSA